MPHTVSLLHRVRVGTSHANVTLPGETPIRLAPFVCYCTGMADLSLATG